MGIDDYAKLMLQFEGTDASTTFLDTSRNPKTITSYTGAEIDTDRVSPFGDYLGIGLFNGTTGYLSTPNSEDFHFGTDAFTFDFWVYFDTISGYRTFYSQDDGVDRFFIHKENHNRIEFYFAGIAHFYTGDNAVSAGAWTHIEIARDGADVYIFINGVSQALTVATAPTALTSFPDLSLPINIGKQYYGNYLDGSLAEFRVSKGVIRHTSNFTPPTIRYIDPLVQLTPSIEWLIQSVVQKTPELQWSIQKSDKFLPNIVTYPFHYLEPKIVDSSSPILVSGSSVGYTLYLGDTGTSGNTVVKIYSGGTLKATKTIVADSSESSNVYFLDLDDLLHPGDTIKIEITEVATGAKDLKVDFYLMTYPFELDKLYFFNKLNDIYYTGINNNTIFTSADKWIIQFNQPIASIDLVQIVDSKNSLADITDFVLEDGLFYNSRVSISPQTNTVNTIRIRAVDMRGQYHVYELNPKNIPNMLDYPVYAVENTITKDLYIAATGYRYSFDGGINWSDWSAVSDENTVVIDFTSLASGSYNVTMQYLNNTDILEETSSIYFSIEDINCSVNFSEEKATILYSDEIPYSSTNIYRDDELIGSNSGYIVNAIDSVSTNSTLGTITIDSGSVYYGGVKYDFDGVAYTISPPLLPEITSYRVLFTFNTSTREFEYTEIEDTSPGGALDYPLDESIPLWSISYIVQYSSLDFSSYSINLGSYAPVKLFSLNEVPLEELLTSTITITILDVAGRSLDFNFSSFSTLVNVWRTLTVSSSQIRSSSEISSGEAINAFDDNNLSYWTSDVSEGLAQWIQYRFDPTTKKTIVEYSLLVRSTDSNSVPEEWVFQGSNDATIWTDLHSIENAGLVGDGEHVYSFSNTTAYTYYRFYILDSVGSSYVTIKEIELRESIGGSDETTPSIDTEILPGQIHQESNLNFVVTTEE